MKMKYVFVVAAAVLAFAAASVNAQTLTLAMSGSSALYTELGQASYSVQGCAWTTGSNLFTLEDTRNSATQALDGNDVGPAWITWTQGTGTGASCATPGAGSVVTIMVKVDSTIGNRCYFAQPRCTMLTTATANLAGSNKLLTGGLTITDTNLPASVLAAVSNAVVNAAATDIRPEDAAFATLRALTPCGTPVVGGSQYLGLGYANASTPNVGVPIVENSLSGTHQFNVINFNVYGNDPILTGNAIPAFTVVPMGAAPVVVFVTPTNTAGFGSLQVSNIDRAQLAGYLDGTYGRAQDIGGTAGSTTTTVFLREPLSGTYNTMEYSIPDSVENQSSQDVGLASLNAFNAGASYPLFNCTAVGGTVAQNALNTSEKRGTGFSHRYRAIGTSDEVASVLAQTTDAMGYSFWGASTFSNALPSNAKYLTVDGIDPIQEVWQDGLIPTAGNDLLGNVSMSHVKDGSYPIWSILRVVADSSSTALTAVQSLQKAVANFISPSQPDFVLNNQLAIVRSHFAPPGITFSLSNAPANGTGSAAESGGDVAGLVYTDASDLDYDTDLKVQTGNVGHRQ